MRKFIVWIIVCCILASMPVAAFAAPDDAEDGTSASPEESVTVSGEIVSLNGQAAGTQAPDDYAAAPEMDRSQITSESARLVATGMLQTTDYPAGETGNEEESQPFIFQRWYLWIVLPAGIFLTLLLIRMVNLGRRRRRRGLYAARRKTLADIRPGARKNIPPDIIPTVIPKSIRPVKPMKRKTNHDSEK